jgi:hypothetical protein
MSDGIDEPPLSGEDDALAVGVEEASPAVLAGAVLDPAVVVVTTSAPGPSPLPDDEQAVSVSSATAPTTRQDFGANVAMAVPLL